MAVAEFDAIVACWDAKYAYWAMRPNQADPTITPLLTTPNHPSYPSAHACAMTAILSVIGSQFPAEAESMQRQAEEAGLSRLWGGIHFRSDIEAGSEIGRKVAHLAIQRAPRTGVE